MKNFSRRAFVAGTAKVSAALGGLVSGIVPELGRAAQMRTFNAPVAADDPPPPLAPALQAGLYSRALNDADVLLLLSTLPERGRLDPPSSSIDFTAAGTGQSMQQVFLPVRSYASGLTLAYVIYGAGTGAIPDGSLQTGMIKAIAASNGSFQLAGNGSIVPSPSPELNVALFVFLFPDEYAAERAAGLTPTSARVPDTARFGKPSFRKVMQAASDPLSDCIYKARVDFTACIQKVQADIAKVLIGLMLLVLCIAILVFATPASSLFSYSCIVAAGATMGLVNQARAKADACNVAYQNAVATCRIQFKQVRVVAA